MINHKYRCIFIHIPRCAGTTMEHTIHVPSNDQETKHLSAFEAKVLYADHWDSYYKFSFVRNPYTRFMSMIKFADNHPNGYYPDGKMYDLLEFAETMQTASHEYISPIQSDILNLEIDYIGRFENLENDFNEVGKAIGLGRKLKSNKYTATENHLKAQWGPMTPEIKEVVRVRWLDDFKRFGYEQ